MDRSIILEIAKARNKSILDVGAGQLAIIAAKNFDCLVTTVDISKVALKEEKKAVRRERLNRRIRFVNGDASCLPCQDNSFDAVISYGALHHVKSDKRKDFLHEASRVAKEKIIIAELDELNFINIHPRGHERVNLNWLKGELNRLGKVEKHSGREREIYLCIKGKK